MKQRPFTETPRSRSARHGASWVRKPERPPQAFPAELIGLRSNCGASCRTEARMLAPSCPDLVSPAALAQSVPINQTEFLTAHTMVPSERSPS
jgi:hypothetical protein